MESGFGMTKEKINLKLRLGMMEIRTMECAHPLKRKKKSSKTDKRKEKKSTRKEKGAMSKKKRKKRGK